MLKALEGYLPTCPGMGVNDVPFDEENAAAEKDKTTEGKGDNSNEKKDDIEVKEEKQETRRLRSKPQKTRSSKKEESTTPRQENKCCSLALEIICTSCLYIMSIFFLCGSTFLHPSTYFDPNRPDEPFVFWTLGAIAYLTTTSIEIYKRRGKKGLEIAMTSLALGGGVFWLIGTIFVYKRTNNVTAWSILWILGSLLNLASITYGIVTVFMKNAPKPLFYTISLGLSWIANLLLLAGVSHILKENKSLSTCEVSNAAGVLISAAVVYLVHSVFHTLAIFKGGVLFSITVAIAAS